MPAVSPHLPGTFCWWELATSHADLAYEFYRTVFGWGKQDFPIGPDQYYRMLDVGGRQVGAMYQLDRKQLERGVPSAWLPYIAVRSADATAARWFRPAARCWRRPSTSWNRAGWP